MKIYALNDYLSTEGECQLGKVPWPDQCCCACRFLLTDYWHCQRMPEALKQPGHCGCEQIRGYICVAEKIHEGRSGTSGWPHHSKGCEMFTKIKEADMEVIETIEELLEPYPVNTALICYRSRQEKKLWFVGAKTGLDSEATLRKHLEQHIPGAEFLWWAIK